MSHSAFIALGSNVGNRAGHLHRALDAMSAYAAIEESSHLYETVPILVTEQPLFLNAVCKVFHAPFTGGIAGGGQADRRFSRKNEDGPLRSPRNRS